MRGWFAVLAALALVAVAQLASARVRVLRPNAHAVFAEEPPVLDGRLDDPIWKQAERIEKFYQRQPVEYGTPSQRTIAWVAYDYDNVYFAFRCYDDTGKVIAQRMVRDEWLVQDDRVSVTLDPLMDERNGYFFQVNAIGARFDGIVEASTVSFDWDGIWDAKAQIDEEGYVVEMAIPYKTMNVNPEQTVWGMQLFRGVHGPGEWVMWASPFYDSGFFNMAQTGYLHGLDGIQQGKGLDIVVNGAGRVVDDGETGRRYRKGDPGLDVFYRVTPSLSASLTANTDFGDTEVDQRAVNLSRFSLFFPEKRKFFLKDFKIFDFAHLSENGRPFFSRRIGLTESGETVGVRAGGKVSGRIGPVNVGLLDVVIDDHDGIDGSNLGVARLSLDFLGESRVGVIATSGDPDSEEDSALYGVDLQLKSSDWIENRQFAAFFWVQQSRNAGVRSDEAAFGTRIEYPNDRTFWRVDVEELQTNFDPKLGFANRTDMRRYELFWRRRQRLEPTSRWGKLLVYVDHEIIGSWITDTENELESARLELHPFWLETHRGGRLEFSYRREREILTEPFPILEGVTIPVGRYSWHRGKGKVLFSGTRPLSGSFTADWGGFFGGTRLDLIGTIEWRPSKHYLIAVEYEQNQVDIDADEFTTRIARFRFNLTFSTELSWNTFIQYDNVTDQIGINSRLRWIVEPGREIVLVLNQGLLVDRDHDLHRGLSEPRAKVSWTYRF
jgi:hypothetical protein